MAADTVKCPECGYIVPIGEALTKEMEASIRKDINKEYKTKEKELLQEIEDTKNEAQEEIKSVKIKFENKIREELASQNEVELQDLKSSLDKKSKALAEANEKELAHRKEVRDLEDSVKNARLDADKALDKERLAIAENTAKEIEEAHRLKDLEKDTKISQMISQIDDLKRKAEQGSQKMQGEVFERDIKDTLKTIFPFDDITDVPSGVKGGDLIQIVKTKSGTECGKILWELKRTRSFSAPWIAKLKSDGRACKADLCLLVSETLPEDIKEFSEVEGVWVSSIPSCIPLAFALRTMLIKIIGEKSIQTGKKEKAELVYDYVTSVEFHGRVEAIVEAFRAMKIDLDSEKRASDKMFAKREKQIQQVILNLAGMHGEFSALAGNALPSVKALEAPQN